MPKKKSMKVHGDLLVKGTKASTIEKRVNEKGFLEDQYGNKIFPTDSKANQDRLAKLKGEKAGAKKKKK